MIRKPIAFILVQFFIGSVCAQISPPGLDDTNAAFWTAVGISQKISDRWSFAVYAGAARESNPDNYSLVLKPAIFVVNQETQYQFDQHWSLSLCASYRTQNRYEEEAPYDEATPEIRKEARYYSRLYFKEKTGRVGLTFSFRPEFRTYYAEHGHVWRPINEEMRFRLKGQASVPLNKSNTNQFIVANEVLSATDHLKDNRAHHWTHYAFTEDRLSTYFRHTFSQPAIIMDLGVMHQIKSTGQYIPHLAFDLIFQNLLWKPKT